MKQNSMLAMILAGGRGSRLHELTNKVAKPAVGYGGKYRIVDFPLSNCANSGIDVVGVLTQYESVLLNSYVAAGGRWGLDAKDSGVYVLPPREKADAGLDVYRGTADAISQNIDFIDSQNPEYLLKCLREFQIDPDTPKRLILIRTYSDTVHSAQAHSTENASVDVKTNTDFSLPEHHIRNLFIDTGITLYTFRYPGDYLAVADSSRFSEISGKLRRFAEQHGDTLSIAVGRSVPLHQLRLSLTTAETALRSLHSQSSVSDTARSFIEHYVLFDNLTLEIVLSSVSPENRKEFAEKTIRHLSDNEKELLRTYFSLEMSLANTAEKLFLHKNTLQYKLNHIYKKCGLNPRKFRDAVLLYLALEME